MNTAHSFIRFTLTGLLMVAGSLHTSVVADTNRQLSSTGQVERAMDNLLRSEAELTTPREIEGDPMSTMPVIQGPCDLYPIPVDPQGPTVTREFTSNDDGFTLTAWRYPCDSSTSHVIFTINPDEGVHPFICSSDLILVQDGIQTDEYKLTQNPGDVGDAHCGDVVVETSFALQAWRFASPLINLEESFDVYWDQGGYNEQFTMFAYDPSAYGGDPPDPELSNDMGISGLFYDPDNPGHGFDIGATTYFGASYDHCRA